MARGLSNWTRVYLVDLLFADMIEHVRIFLPKKTTADGGGVG